MSVCVRACVRACVRVYVCVCVSVLACVCVRGRARACVCYYIRLHIFTYFLQLHHSHHGSAREVCQWSFIAELLPEATLHNNCVTT